MLRGETWLDQNSERVFVSKLLIGPGDLGRNYGRFKQTEHFYGFYYSFGLKAVTHKLLLRFNRSVLSLKMKQY